MIPVVKKQKPSVMHQQDPILRGAIRWLVINALGRKTPLAAPAHNIVASSRPISHRSQALLQLIQGLATMADTIFFFRG